MGLVWRAARSRPRLLSGVAAMIVPWPLLPRMATGTTRGIIAWDIGVLVYLLSSAQLFASASPDHTDRRLR